MAGIPLAGAQGEDFKRRIGFPEGWEFGVAVLVGFAKGAGTPHAVDMSKVRFLGE
jgi:hypothetical protein